VKNMETELTKQGEKKPYEKPGLRTIELVADEVLAVGCKNASVFAVGAPACTVTPCVSGGS